MKFDFSTKTFKLSSTSSETFFELKEVIIKNENVYSFPFKELVFRKGEKELKYHIIKIDYGDGTKEVHNELLKVSSEYLDIVQPDWDEIEHEFLFENDNDTKVEIKFYFITGDIFTLSIPVKVKLAGLDYIGLDFQILSAHLTNDDRVSYVIKHVNTDSIIIVHSIKDIEKEKRS